MIQKGKTKFSSLFFVTQENDSYREYCLPFGWKKTGYLRQNGKTWDFFVFSPNGKKFRSTVEVNRYLDQNPDVQCDRSVTNTLKPSDLTSPKSNGMVHNCRKDNSFVIYTLCCESIRSFPFLWCKMPMFRRAGMREGGKPLPLAFQYLIFMA